MGTRIATVAVIFAIALVGAATASADSFTVTKTADTNGVCVIGNCSLREAVKAANANDEDDVIQLPAGQYTLTGIAGEDAAESGDLDVADANDELLIDAMGGTPGETIISGGGIDRVFDILQFAHLELRDVKLVGGGPAGDGGAIRNFDGELLIRSSILEGNVTGGDGGAIYSAGENRPRVTIEASALIGNFASSDGGAIATQDESRLVVINSSMSGNEAVGSRGGAIYNQGFATATIVDSMVSGNRSFLDGGGIGTQNDSSLTMVRSTIVDNRATTEEGGGIWAQNSSTVAIVDSTLTGNRSLDADDVDDGGGAIWAQNDVVLTISGSTVSGNLAQRHGGGIYVRNFVWLTMQNSTVVGNAAAQRGGAIYAENSPIVQIDSSTIAGNSAAAGGGVFDETVSSTSPFRLRSTIVATNTAAGSPNDCDGAVAGGVYASFSFNLDSTGTCDFNATADISNGFAGLGPLAFNGGTTQTMALQPGSQAIDTASTACPGFDQRGAPRAQGSACDIGAFESSPLPTPPPAPDTTAPDARLLGKKTQKLGKRVVVRVQCRGGEACIVKASGSLRIKGSGKALPLKSSKRATIAPGATRTLSLPVPKKTRARAVAALLTGKKVQALIRVRVADAAGNERLLKRTLRLT